MGTKYGFDVFFQWNSWVVGIMIQHRSIYTREWAVSLNIFPLKIVYTHRDPDELPF